MTEREPDVLIVGAGSSGCALAARLSEDPDRRVLLLDEGPDHGADGYPERVVDPATLPSPSSDRNWTRWTEVQLHAGRRTVVPRGRSVGGTSAVNGTYFVRATRDDLTAWARHGATEWSFERVLPAYRRLESDHDFASTDWHGDTGPIPVSRPSSGAHHPVTRGFLDAAAAGGHPLVVDLNEPGASGAGPVPCNVTEGRRVNVAMAYLDPCRDRDNLTVRGGVRVRRVVVEGGRAIGVEVDAGRSSRVLRAGEVVLSAGAVATAQLLMLSGVGPAEHLLLHGIDVVVDAPGVGRLLDHPAIDLFWDAPGLPPAPAGPAFQAALHLASGVAGAGRDDLELLAMVRPYGVADGADPGDAARSLRIGIQRTEEPGRVRLESAAPHAPPVVDLGYLAGDDDRARARAGVRLAVELLRSEQFAGAVRPTLRGGPSAAELSDDRRLDDWVLEHLGTSMHPMGTAAMGADHDPSAVVDQRCRVRGVDGLRVVDMSVVPVQLSRGPAATAVMIGERAAELLS